MIILNYVHENRQVESGFPTRRGSFYNITMTL